MQKNTGLLFFVFLLLTHFCFSQNADSTTRKADSTKKISHFSGSVGVTHNGISLIPTFSLGKPAITIMLSTGKGKLSFEPDMRFALEGKPWGFVFWFRYKLLNTGKFKINIGAHPALNFRTFRLPMDGDSADVIAVRRFLAGEFFPNYQLSKNVNIGMYYLFARGFDKNVAKHNQFLTINSNISNIGLPGKMLMQFNPQVYYLKQDKNDGFYYTATVILARKKFPLSVSAIINKTIRSNIPGNKDFVWNASLVYSFSKKYNKI